MNRLALSVVLLACAASAQAATQNVYLADLANQAANPYAHDSGPGHVVVTGGATSAPGFGNSSFFASVNTTTANRYSTFRVNLESALGRSVTVGDLDNLSYWTNTSGQLDWRASIYTKRTATDNLGSFYKSRIQTLPSSDNDTLWSQRSTVAGGLKFTETNLDGAQSYDTWTWDQIQAGTVTASNNATRDFRSEEIFFIDFTLGANNGGGISQGELDGIVFSLGNETFSLNLEAVIPLPTSSIMGLGLLSAGILGRRR